MREEIFEGKSEEEALLKASDGLGVNISEMTYDVIEDETGLFGLFKKSVKIRVRVPDEPAGIVYRKEVKAPEKKRLESRNDVAADDVATGDVEAGEEEELPIKGPEAKSALEGILQRMDVEAEVSMSEDERVVSLDIKTDEEDMVVGRDGEVLTSLQFVVNKMVNRFQGDRKRVLVDAGGFRERRSEDISRLANEMGEKAIETGKVVRMTPMNAHDRRLVHMALKSHSGLNTRSEGHGMFRCILIVPRGFRERRPGRGGGRGGSQGRRPRQDRDREQTA